MEFLIGMMLTGLAEALKKLSDKFGKTITTAGVYVVLLFGAICYAYMNNAGFFATETYATIATVMTSAIGVYELLIKRVAKPILKQ